MLRSVTQPLILFSVVSLNLSFYVQKCHATSTCFALVSAFILVCQGGESDLDLSYSRSKDPDSDTGIKYHECHCVIVSLVIRGRSQVVLKPKPLSHHPKPQVSSSNITGIIIQNHKFHHTKPKVSSSKTTGSIIQIPQFSSSSYHRSHNPKPQVLSFKYHRSHHPNTTGLIIQIPQGSLSKYHMSYHPNTTNLIIQILQVSLSK